MFNHFLLLLHYSLLNYASLTLSQYLWTWLSVPLLRWRLVINAACVFARIRESLESRMSRAAYMAECDKKYLQ